MKNWYALVWFWIWLSPEMGLAQEKTIHLPDVSISAKAFKTSQKFDTKTVLDSSRLFEGQDNLTSLLSRLPSCYLKNYGPGGIATIALRGTAAAHTAIVWKGIPINNGMLGSIDLNQISGPVLADARIQEGGASQMAVTENFGGVVELGETENKQLKNKIDLGLGIGSFSMFRNHIGIQHQIKKVGVDIKMWNYASENNFSYQLEGVEKKQIHAHRLNRGLVSTLTIPITRHLHLESALWTQKNESELAPTLFQEKSEARQMDNNFRISNRLAWALKNIDFHFGHGFTEDKINFNDPLANIESRSRIQTHLAWAEVNKGFRNWSLSGNIWTSVSNARTNNYSKNQGIGRYAFTGKASYQIEKIPVSIQGQVRIERDSYQTPGKAGKEVLPSGTAVLDLGKCGVLKSGLHKKMRIPTLNDLFWHQGGNINLIPEKGWTYDLDWNIKKRLWKNGTLETNLQLYQSLIDNYIQWLPNGQIWTPKNIARVQIYGTSFSNRLTQNFGKAAMYTAFGFSINKSVNTRQRFSGDESANKQLIYIPLCQGNLELGVIKDEFEWRNWFQLTDRRFVDPANTLWLPRFYTLNARVSYEYKKLENISLRFFGEGLNLSEKSYQMVAGFPMPGRQFSFGVQLQFL